MIVVGSRLFFSRPPAWIVISKMEEPFLKRFAVFEFGLSCIPSANGLLQIIKVYSYQIPNRSIWKVFRRCRTNHTLRTSLEYLQLA